MVLIDLQNAIVSRDTKPYSASEVIERSRKLADAFRAKSAPVVYVRVVMSDFLSLPADEVMTLPKDISAHLSEIAESTGRQNGHLLISKRHWGAFAGTGLEHELRSRGVETLVLAGIATNMGVESTLRQGTGLGFAFVTVEVACSTFSQQMHDFAFSLRPFRASPRFARHSRSSKRLPSRHVSPDKLPAGIWKVACVAMLGSLMAQIDATVVNVSLSSLAASLHSSLATIQWVTSGYLLALALMLPLSGWLVDRIGARSLYLWCFSAFIISSAPCGLAWSAGSLIGFRTLQGMAGGLMAQMIMAPAAGRHMAKVFGYVAIPVLMGLMLGPVLAGAILQHLTWQWLFLVNVPFGALAVALAVLFIPADYALIQRRTFDLPGFLTLAPALVLFLYGADNILVTRGSFASRLRS